MAWENGRTGEVEPRCPSPSPPPKEIVHDARRGEPGSSGTAAPSRTRAARADQSSRLGRSVVTARPTVELRNRAQPLLLATYGFDQVFLCAFERKSALAPIVYGSRGATSEQIVARCRLRSARAPRQPARYRPKPPRRFPSAANLAGVDLRGRGSNGVGHALPQRLLADGEHVVDVPANLAAGRGCSTPPQSQNRRAVAGKPRLPECEVIVRQ